MAISTTTPGVQLPPEVSNEILSQVQDRSVVMNLARRVTLSGAGTVYHEILTDPVPEFVGETERKPLSDATVGAKTLKPHKIAVVNSFSDEFKRDLPGLYNALIARLPGALGRTFDLAALHGIGAPAADFDDLSGATPVVIANTTPGSDDAFQGFLEALGVVADAGGDVTAWALSTQAEILALGNRDTSGGPIFIGNVQAEGSVGSILGRPVFRSQNARDDTDNTVGIAGDWTAAVWGSVSGVEISISDNPVYGPTGTLVNAGWQDNMINVRSEIHVGFIADDSKFARLTSAVAGP